MSKAEKLLAKARERPNSLRFGELVKMCEAIGMARRNPGGSHVVYVHPCSTRPIPIQKGKAGCAKAYQVRQILSFIDEYGLKVKG